MGIKTGAGTEILLSYGIFLIAGYTFQLFLFSKSNSHFVNEESTQRHC